MKRSIVYFLLSVLASASILVSCKEEEIPLPDPLSFDIKITDITPESAQVTINPSHDQSTYFWNFRPIEEYESLGQKGVIKEDLENLQKIADESQMELSDYLEIALPKGAYTQKLENLEQEMPYCAYVYEVDCEGIVKGEITAVNFITPKEPCNIRLAIKSLGMTYIDYEAVPANEELRYYVDCMPEATYQQYGGTDDAAATYFRESLEYTAENRGTTVENLVQRISCFGTIERRREGLKLDTDYRVYAVEIDEKGIASNWTTIPASTIERQMSDLKIDINILNMNSFKAEVEFVPSNDEEYYYYQMWPVKEYEEKVEEVGDYREYCIKTWGPYLPELVKQGRDVAVARKLQPEEDYIIIAFGYKDGAWVTDLFTKTVKIPAAQPGNDLTTEIEISKVESHYAEVKVIPSSDEILYMFNCMSEDLYKELGNDTIVSVQNYVNAYFQQFYDQYPDMPRSQIVRALCTRSTRMNVFPFLKPSTRHFIWAAAIDTSGQVVSDPNLKEFTTKEYILAENTAVKNVEYKYWDGDTVAVYMPIFERQFKGRVASVVTNVDVEGTDTWIGYFFKGDIMDNEKYPDYYVASNLFFSGRKNLGETASTIFSHTWEDPWTLCFVPVDENGNFGPVYRELVNYTREGAYPITEFPRYDDFHPTMLMPNDFMLNDMPKLDFSNMVTAESAVEDKVAEGPVFQYEIDQSAVKTDNLLTFPKIK